MESRLIHFIIMCLGLSRLLAPASILYVDVNSTNPVPPYSILANAAISIQDAVDTATNGDLILVNNGVYQNGFRLTLDNIASPPYPSLMYVTNRIVVDKPVTVQSINGPAVTFINGGNMCRCAYLTNYATLSGFTLLNGLAGSVTNKQSAPGKFITTSNAINGGGVATANAFSGSPVWVSNCVIYANRAYGNGGGAYMVNLINCILTSNTAVSGGGAFNSTLINCRVTGNSTSTNGMFFGDIQLAVMPAAGGGIYGGSAFNCLISSNAAFDGGGVYQPQGLVNCTIVNNFAKYFGGVGYYPPAAPVTPPYSYAYGCIIYFNTASNSPNFGTSNLFGVDCCTFPLPVSGSGSLTNNPGFVNYFGGDFHLLAGSRCINSGNNDSVTNSTDLDGNPRITGGTVDIGAYEFPNPATVLSYAWAKQYGLPTDGSVDYADPDGDGMNNWQEWIAGTNPTNAASVLTMTSVWPEPRLNVIVVKWKSVSTRNYFLQRGSRFGGAGSFSIIQTNITGWDGTTIYYDYTATNGGPYFYRVGVQP